MKHIKTITAFLVAAMLFSFSGNDNPVKKDVKVKESKVTWKGYKFTGSHYGTINIKSANLEFDDEKLSGGEFIIDMTTINNQDLEGEWKTKLEGHLKSDDFFSVEKFPEAKLVMTNVVANSKNSYDITADLTIKGKTLPIEFTASVYGSKATASMKVDRAKYNVQYGSSSFFEGLADKVIYDEFELVADIEF